ncbi:MAG: hypothetical protein M1449_11140 [Candidatus Thermoplasmatota archaeon]|nr:hypothetical protein [Candidatus Thermoplasmatota archaeon]
MCFITAFLKLCKKAIAADLALALLLNVANAHAEQPKSIDSARYEDHFAFKPGAGTYTVDPWVWAYTPEFADKFRMPKKWVDKDLKGLLGVSFVIPSFEYAWKGPRNSKGKGYVQ